MLPVSQVSGLLLLSQLSHCFLLQFVFSVLWDIFDNLSLLLNEAARSGLLQDRVIGSILFSCLMGLEYRTQLEAGSKKATQLPNAPLGVSATSICCYVALLFYSLTHLGAPVQQQGGGPRGRSTHLSVISPSLRRPSLPTAHAVHHVGYSL